MPTYTHLDVIVRGFAIRAFFDQFETLSHIAVWGDTNFKGIPLTEEVEYTDISSVLLGEIFLAIGKLERQQRLNATLREIGKPESPEQFRVRYEGMVMDKVMGLLR